MTLKAFDVCNILLHIMLISAFLGSYFFTFGTYLEREVLQDQLNYLVDTTLDPIKILVPTVSEDIKKKIKSYNFKINENADIKTEEQNKKTVDKAIKFITLFIVIGLIVIVILSKILDRDGMTYEQFFKKLFMHNLIILIFIASTEFIFAFFFVKKYMSIDTNKIKKQIFVSLNKIKNQNLPYKLIKQDEKKIFYQIESLLK
jgi:hypothetical protein